MYIGTLRIWSAQSGSDSDSPMRVLYYTHNVDGSVQWILRLQLYLDEE